MIIFWQTPNFFIRRSFQRTIKYNTNVPFPWSYRRQTYAAEPGFRFALANGVVSRFPAEGTSTCSGTPFSSTKPDPAIPISQKCINMFSLFYRLLYSICIACSTRTLDLGNIFDQFFRKWNYNHDIILLQMKMGCKFMLTLTNTMLVLICNAKCEKASCVCGISIRVHIMIRYTRSVE